MTLTPAPAPAPAPTPTLVERMDAAYADLSPQEQRAASFMRDHLADLAVYNATEVARHSGVSKATISRLYRRLGFESAEELRDHVRVLRSTGVPLVSDLPQSASAQFEQEIANLRAVLGSPAIAKAGALIAGARRVVVIGFRNSYPVALHLRQQLAQARDRVELAPLPGQSIGEEIATLGADDVVVLVGFRRRPKVFEQLLTALAGSVAQTVVLTDATGRRFSDRVAIVIECPVDSVTAFDSYAAAMGAVTVLAATVLSARLAEGRTRIAAISATYSELGELEGS